MLKLVIYILTLVSFVAGNLFAQNAKEDIIKINQAYADKNSHLSMEVSYNLYNNYASKQIAETKKSMVKKQGDFHHVTMDGIETIMTKNFVIVVDPSEKIILLGNPVKADEKLMMVNLEKITEQCSSVDYIEVSANSGGYKLSFKKEVNSNFEMVDVIYNKQSYMPEKMVLYYRNAMPLNPEDPNSKKDKVRLEIVFDKVDHHPKLDKAVFNESYYITKVKGKEEPTEKYKGYKILNQKVAN